MLRFYAKLAIRGFGILAIPTLGLKLLTAQVLLTFINNGMGISDITYPGAKNCKCPTLIKLIIIIVSLKRDTYLV